LDRVASTPGCSTRAIDRAPGVGIEPTPPGSEPGVTTSSNYPGIIERKERESNPQDLAVFRFRDGCHRPLACPSGTSCPGWIRTSTLPVNSRLRYPLRHGTIGRVGAVGFEPTLS